MAFRLAELFVEIGARTGGINGALAGLHSNLLGMGPLGTRLSGAIHGATQAFQGLGVMGPLALSAAAAGIGALVLGLTHCALEAAHLQEAVAKTEQAFGSATPKVLAMADELARKFGVVRKEILDTAASFGLMLQGAGITRELSADLSVALSRIAVDAASYFDVSMQEAIQRLQSGLSGEMEAVRRWGVNLSETNIVRQARVMGYDARDSQDLDQNTKTLIRYKLIMEGLSAAQGDAERSQGRLVGQWKLFTGQVTELAMAYGERLIPILTAGLHVLNFFLGAWVGIEQAINRAGKALLNWTGGLLGWDISGSKQTEADRQAIDARIAGVEADRKADDARVKAQETEAAAKKKEARGWSGDLVGWASRIQDAAWSIGKDKVARDQLKEAEASRKLLEDIRNKLSKPIPVLAP